MSARIKVEGEVALILSRDQLPFTGSSHELEGYAVGGGIPVSLILLDMQPGEGPALHAHPYAEIFVVLEGTATYTVGDRQVEVEAGQIVIAMPNEPHGFINTGDGPLRQVDIHCNERFVTEWLEGSGTATRRAPEGTKGLILSRDEFPFSGSSHKFEGHLFGNDVPVSIFFVDAQPGRGAKLHCHPYAEVFITLEGKATFTVGDDQFHIVAGQVVIAMPNEPHAFVNSGDGPLRQIDIHCNDRIIQRDLEVSAPEAAAS